MMKTSLPRAAQVRHWWPDVLLFGVMTAIVLLEIPRAESHDPHSSLLYVGLGLASAAAVGLARRAPGTGLSLVSAVIAVQAVTGVDLLLSEAAFVLLAFGAARWGGIVTLWASGLSILLGPLSVLWLVRSGAIGVSQYAGILGSAHRLGASWQPVAVVAGAAVLGIPWLTGLSLRLGAQARTSSVLQAEAEQTAQSAVRLSEHAQELAQLRDEQTRLARDVHDVVGHSLTVILVQAESAQYLDDADSEALQQTLQSIASSARSSLTQIRQVLSSLGDEPTDIETVGLDSLIEGVRSSGRTVLTTETGEPHPLTAELDLTAFRVVQEMLTNALKHGCAEQPIHVDRHWGQQLRIDIRNAVAPAGVQDPFEGTPDQQGLDGMRRRLEIVGGRLEVQQGKEPPGASFTATAWLPLQGEPR